MPAHRDTDRDDMITIPITNEELFDICAMRDTDRLAHFAQICPASELNQFVADLINDGCDVNRVDWLMQNTNVKLEDEPEVMDMVSNMCTTDDTEYFTWLLQHSAAAKRLVREGDLLSVACRELAVGILRCMLTAYDNIPYTDDDCGIYSGFEYGSLPLIKLLLEYYPHIDLYACDCANLEIACDNNHVDIVQWFLENNPAPDEKILVECLCQAIERKYFGVADVLVKHGALSSLESKHKAYNVIKKGSAYIHRFMASCTRLTAAAKMYLKSCRAVRAKHLCNGQMQSAAIEQRRTLLASIKAAALTVESIRVLNTRWSHLGV